MDSLGNPGDWLLSEKVSGLDAGIGLKSNLKNHMTFSLSKIMKPQKITIFKKELPQIKVIGRYSSDVINFEIKEDFIEYLDKHREELNQLSTCKLNKLCIIKGYHITKLKGEISLRSARKSETIESK